MVVRAPHPLPILHHAELSSPLLLDHISYRPGSPFPLLKFCRDIPACRTGASPCHRGGQSFPLASLKVISLELKAQLLHPDDDRTLGEVFWEGHACSSHSGCRATPPADQPASRPSSGCVAAVTAGLASLLLRLPPPDQGPPTPGLHCIYGLCAPPPRGQLLRYLTQSCDRWNLRDIPPAHRRHDGESISSGADGYSDKLCT